MIAYSFFFACAIALASASETLSIPVNTEVETVFEDFVVESVNEIETLSYFDQDNDIIEDVTEVETEYESYIEEFTEVETVFEFESFTEEDVLSSVSDNSVYSYIDDYVDDKFQLMSTFNTYYGSIPTQYLEYMRGYLSKLPPDSHYVASRVSQYDYIFAFSPDLIFNGSTFTSPTVSLISFNTYNSGAFSYRVDTDFVLSPGSNLVYTDLSDIYPALSTSSDVSLRQIVMVIAIAIAFWTLSQLFVRRSVRAKSRKWRR